MVAKATVRAGPEKDSPKIGEFSKGTVITVTDTSATDQNGLRVFLTTTAPRGAKAGRAGGAMYVKELTSKKKKLLEPVGAES